MPTALGKGFFDRIRKHKFLYLLAAPGLLYFFLFDYVPMYGVLIAFQDFKPFAGVEQLLIHPNWIGLDNFKDFFNSYYFGRLLRNTLLISSYKLLFGFPAPILLALLINEIYHNKFKRLVQTISYLPHFLSIVIVSGLLYTLLSPANGPVNAIITASGGEAIPFLSSPDYFRSILVASDIWASVGWGSIVYLAVLAGIDPGQYESARIDGANRFQQMMSISLPGMANIISILFILAVGGILNAGFQQVLLLYSPGVYNVGDIIDTFVYREGLINSRYSYAQSVGVFKSLVGLLFLLITNYIVRRLGKEGIW
ncbi:MAG: sugar ABC transporter permease [Paenibacillaceae bacterium]|nr:sugar ABC transporter permease [Paenibacillaceae bacterium]